MKITPELLERFGIPCEDKEPILFTNAILSYNYPPNLFHYIREYYRLSEEEFELYCKVYKIEMCSNFWYSTHIKQSSNIYNSFNIYFSNFVRNSNDISVGSYIYNAQTIRSSTNIAYSTTISNSHRIIESQKIDDSEDVARSNNISWSKVILNSSQLKDCNYIYKSDNLVDCHFCGFTRNSRHCLFCVGLENKEYYIFNEPVSQLEYERTKEILLSKLEEEKSSMIRINENKYTAEERFKLNKRFDSIFNGLSSSLYGWIGTLPNYSDDVFVDIFFRDREEVI